MTTKKQKFIIWYDEEGDYLEVLFRKCADTYFEEIQDHISRIIDSKTHELVGYALFNFSKRKEKYLDLELPLPQQLVA
ncbi:hypothetical protein HYS50_00445 [Candidatus Woesearchaeota archaeon]|nr:hypothetical protein [Candidatus Woesearchaeota archaeon]